MSRWASGTNETAAAAPDTPLRLLVDLAFASGTVYANSGIGDLVWSGNTYLGLGAYGGFQQILEEAQVNPKPITLMLAGIPNELINTAMTEVYQGRTANLWWGIVNPETNAWIANPEVLWTGIMDTMAIDLGPTTSTISLVCEDPDYGQPQARRYTLQDHQMDYAGDKGLEWITNIPGFKGNWGQPGMGYGNMGSSGAMSYPGGGGGGGTTGHPGYPGRSL
jgi:hypothetical protein